MLTKAGQDALPVGRANCARLPPEALPAKRTVAGSGVRMYRGSGRQVAGNATITHAGCCWPPTLPNAGPPHGPRLIERLCDLGHTGKADGSIMYSNYLNNDALPRSPWIFREPCEASHNVTAYA